MIKAIIHLFRELRHQPQHAKFIQPILKELSGRGWVGATTVEVHEALRNDFELPEGLELWIEAVEHSLEKMHKQRLVRCRVDNGSVRWWLSISHFSNEPVHKSLYPAGEPVTV